MELAQLREGIRAGTTMITASAGAVGVAASALAAFEPLLRGSWQYVWDDTENFGDVTLSHLRWSKANADWWLKANVLRVYEPVALAAKATAAEIFGELTPENLHRTALVSHASCAVLSFVGSLAFLSREKAAANSPVWRTLCCAAGSALFAVHPICVQAVCWSSCLPYLWATTLCWLSVLSYLGAVSGSTQRCCFLAVLSALLYFAAAMCKAAVLGLPAAVFPLRVLLRRERHGDGKGISSMRCFRGCLDLPLWLAFALATSLVLQAATGDDAEQVEAVAIQLDLKDNVLRASTSVFLYLYRLIHPGHELIPFSPVALGGLSAEQRWLGLLALAVLGGLTLAALVALQLALAQNAGYFSPSWAQVVACSWLAFLTLLSPCLQLVQHGDPVWFADRYAYVAAALVLPVVAARALEWAGNGQRVSRLVIAAIVGPALLSLGMQSRRSCELWRSGVSLWSAAVAAQPTWAEFHHQLGVSLAGAGRHAEALLPLQKAWGLRPDPLTAKALGRTFGIDEPAKGAKWLEKSLTLAGKARDAAIQKKEHRGSDAANNVGLSNAQAASVYHDLAVLKSRLPRPDLEEVLALYRQSLALAPERPLTQENCGLVLAYAERYEEATAHLMKAKHMGRQSSAELQSGLGAVHFAKGELKKAAASFEKALELRPGWKAAKDNLEAVRAELAATKRGRARGKSVQ